GCLTTNAPATQGGWQWTGKSDRFSVLHRVSRSYAAVVGQPPDWDTVTGVSNVSQNAFVLMTWTEV
ncbi:MAG: hypothetical protein KC544_15215, partial [Gemmatimonadetes bacterium]|nr:hypothetical protein [Gemmatimonadota bacterium]